MKLGTKSLLFGAHQFIIHPIIVFICWWKLYGFPFDPRLWIAFVIHDWGYWGLNDMDGPNGKMHPLFAARIMGKLFGTRWFIMCYYHSRFLAKRERSIPSKLCYADKLSIVVEPSWLYLPRVKLSGELKEYMEEGSVGLHLPSGTTPPQWHRALKEYMTLWIKAKMAFYKEHES